MRNLILLIVYCIALSIVVTYGNKAEGQDQYYKKEAIELEKKAETLFYAGLESLENNDFLTANAYFKQVINISPNKAEAFANLALSNFYLQNFSEAIENLDHALELGMFGVDELTEMLAPYRAKEYLLELFPGHNIQMHGTSICSEQLIRDVLRSGVGVPTSITTKFIEWGNKGEYWLENWKLIGEVSMNDINVKFFPTPDGGNTFVIGQNK